MTYVQVLYIIKCPCLEYIKTYSKPQKYPSFFLSEPNYFLQSALEHPVFIFFKKHIFLFHESYCAQCCGSGLKVHFCKKGELICYIKNSKKKLKKSFCCHIDITKKVKYHCMHIAHSEFWLNSCQFAK